MKFNLKKLGVSAGLIGCVAGPIIGLTAPQAGAIPPVSHPGRTLVAVGSDTTYWMMGAITPKYNLDGVVNTGTKDVVNNVPPQVVSPFPSSFTTRGDSDCSSVTYDSGNTPPNGSSAGISALVADNTGCIDFARSSRGQKGTDAASLEFYAYALDALDWGKFPGTKAPATGLTQQNLIDIYTCNPATGAPYISDWHTLNSKAAVGSTIQKFAPQTQSGTYSFFNTKLLNGATIDAGCDNAHKSTFLEEHNATGVGAASKPFAIFPMSYAQFKSDAAKKTPDLRNGITMGKLNGLLPTGVTVHEAAVPTRFLGTRYVFNVADTTSKNYDDVIRFAGVDNAGPGYICNNKVKPTITAYGFRPLTLAATGGGVTINSYCRLDPAAL